MRTLRGLAGLAFVAAFAAACSAGGGAPPSARRHRRPDRGRERRGARLRRPRRRPRRPTRARPRTLALKTAGKLTIGADNPAYPPYFEPSDTNTDPWELGDPTNGMGFESAVGLRDRPTSSGFVERHGHLGRRRRSTTRSRRAPRTSTSTSPRSAYSAERAQAVDLSATATTTSPSPSSRREGRKLAKATTIAGLKDFQFGAQVGTTSLKTINRRHRPVQGGEGLRHQRRSRSRRSRTARSTASWSTCRPRPTSPPSSSTTASSSASSPDSGGAASTSASSLDKDSPLTACVNAAIGRLTRPGDARAHRHSSGCPDRERPGLPALTHGPGCGPGGGRGGPAAAARRGPRFGLGGEGARCAGHRGPSRPSSSSALHRATSSSTRRAGRGSRRRSSTGRSSGSRCPSSIDKFWVNVRLFLIAEALILVFGLRARASCAACRARCSSRCGSWRRSTSTCSGPSRACWSSSCSASGIPALRIEGLPNDEFFWAVIALTLVYSAYVSEVYRAGHRLGPPEPGGGRAVARPVAAADHALRRASRRRCGA